MAGRRRFPARSAALWLALPASLLALLLARAGKPPAARGQVPTPVGVALQWLAGPFQEPVAIAQAEDDRLFVAERRGTIRVVAGSGQVLETPFLDLSALVATSSWEQGLLGLAFHPQYGQNGFFYVNYTGLDGATNVVRYSVDPTDPDRADAGSATPILSIPQPSPIHNAGSMQFGPDGLLYIAVGDGGPEGDPERRGQDLSSLLGKLLRLDVDGGTPYAIPPDNPFAADGDPAGTRDEIWAYGLRNPWRFALDGPGGTLFVADVGNSQQEELNIQPLAPAGYNFGWSCREGVLLLRDEPPCDQGADLLPAFWYNHVLGRCGIIGGLVYRGSLQPELSGLYLASDFCSREVWLLPETEPGQWRPILLGRLPLNLSAFGQDSQGELLAAAYFEGSIYRVVAQPLPALPAALFLPVALSP